MQEIKNRKPAAMAALFVTAIVWGTGFIATQMSIDAGFSSGNIMLLRFGTATVAMLLIFNRKLFPVTKKELKCGAIVGFFLFSGFYTQVWGLNFTSLSHNGFLTAVNVVLVPFIAWLIMKKRPSVKVFVSSAVCLGGVMVLTYTGDRISFNRGDILTVLCAVLFATHIAYTQKCAEEIDTAKLTFLQMLFAFIYAIPVFLAFDMRSLAGCDISGLPAVIYLGLFPTCLCFFLQTFAQKVIPAGPSAVVLCTESLWCSVLSVLLGYEAVTLNMVLGGAIILISIVMLEVKIKGKKAVQKSKSVVK
ncbi:MAG: DMT family transporter [Clostridiales bacterium]|nr:DMT family transporter [Clostridiales bacterium]